MHQLVAAALGIAAAVFVWAGDPVVGFLFALCAVVWLAVTRTFSRTPVSLPAVREIE